MESESKEKYERAVYENERELARIEQKERNRVRREGPRVSGDRKEVLI